MCCLYIVLTSFNFSVSKQQLSVAKSVHFPFFIFHDLDLLWIRVNSWPVSDSCWFVLDSSWFVLTRFGLMLIFSVCLSVCVCACVCLYTTTVKASSVVFEIVETTDQQSWVKGIILDVSAKSLYLSFLGLSYFTSKDEIPAHL